MTRKKTHITTDVATGDLALSSRLLRFGVVGLGATATHTLVYLLATARQLPPLWANDLGFAAAFTLSFAGHWRWTFADSASSFTPALLKFLVTSFLGFASNSFFVWLLVDRLYLPSAAALPVFLVLTPLLVFAASHFWAFAPTPRPR